MSITVVIPTIEGRYDKLQRAVASVQAQTLAPELIELQLDQNREGAGATRNRVLERVHTEYVAFLDDDDELKPNHLRICARYAALSGVDVVYPWFDTEGGEDPIGCFGVPFSAALLRRRNYIPVTVLARTELVRAVGGFRDHPDENGDPCEDWGLWLALLDAGATFGHVPQRTWIWHLNGGTRGRGMTQPEAAGQPYIVGEQGPELFVPSSSGCIMPSAPEPIVNRWELRITAEAEVIKAPKSEVEE